MEEPSWAVLYQACQAGFLRYLRASPLAEVSADPRVDWVITGVWSNTHNGVTGARLPAGSADEVIRDVMSRFRAAGVPGTWFITDGDQPGDLPDRLERSGCQPERSGVVMGVARGAMHAAPPAPLPADVRIVEVLDGDALELWFAAAAETWEEGAAEPADPTRPTQQALYLSLGLAKNRPWRHWVALRGSEPVGMVSAFYTDLTIALENVGVVEPERRRGIGRALTLTAIRAAQTDARWVVLGPSPEGALLYGSLGFTQQPCLPDQEFYLPVGPVDSPLWGL